MAIICISNFAALISDKLISPIPVTNLHLLVIISYTDLIFELRRTIDTQELRHAYLKAGKTLRSVSFHYLKAKISCVKLVPVKIK